MMHWHQLDASQPVPEPGFATAVLIGVLWIALVVWMTKRLD